MYTEAAIRDSIANNLTLIEPDLKLIKKEYPLNNTIGTNGFIDILAYDTYGNFVIIEIKKSKASSRQTIQEVIKYSALIKQNYRVKDSEIRIIIISPNWEELFAPFCELYHQTTIQVTGYEIEIDNRGMLISHKQVKPEKITTVSRNIVPHYFIDLFFDEKKRDSHISYLVARSTELTIEDYVILTLDAPPENFDKYPYKYATCYAFNTIEKEKLLFILGNLDELDMSEEEFDTIHEYIDYLYQTLLAALKTYINNDLGQAADPTELHRILVLREMTFGTIFRQGLFKNDPRLSDEMLMRELNGLDGANNVLYSNFGESAQRKRIKEIEDNCIIPFQKEVEWVVSVQRVWQFMSEVIKNYRTVVTVFSSGSVFDATWRFMRTGDEGYLPSYHIIIDCLDKNLLYNFEGGLSWNGKASSVAQIADFVEDGRNVLFGKPIDLINGSFDDKILALFNLEWENTVTIISEGKIVGSGVTVTNDYEINVVEFRNKTMNEWRENNRMLLSFLNGFYMRYTNFIN